MEGLRDETAVDSVAVGTAEKGQAGLVGYNLALKAGPVSFGNVWGIGDDGVEGMVGEGAEQVRMDEPGFRAQFPRITVRYFQGAG